MSRYETVSNVFVKVTDRFNSLLGGPAGPLKTRAMLASFAPSLMPRPSINQGMAAAASVLAAELVGQGVNGAINRAIPRSSPFVVRIGARAVVTAVGLAVSRIPETDDETTSRASVRSEVGSSPPVPLVEQSTSPFWSYRRGCLPNRIFGPSFSAPLVLRARCITRRN
jgi:hypothetical protein